MQVDYYPMPESEDEVPEPVTVDLTTIVSEALYDNPQEAYRILFDQLERHAHVLKARLPYPDKQGVLTFAKSIGA